MKLNKLTILLCFITLTVANFSVLGQSNFNLKLSKRSPDGWFSLRVPKIMGKVERHADVDGGFYITDALEIDYTFWTFGNTPNWLRDVINRYSKSPILECPAKDKRTQTLRTKIDGKRAIIQQCSKTYEREGFRYVYYITFPKVKVSNGEHSDYGMFNFTIKYKNRRYLPVAEKIVRSINYLKN